MRRAKKTFSRSRTIRCFSTSVLSEIALFQAIVEIGCRVQFAVIFDFLIASRFYYRPVLERELIDRVLEVLFFHEYALERFRVEAEGGTALQALLMCIQIDVFEF